MVLLRNKRAHGPDLDFVWRAGEKRGKINDHFIQCGTFREADDPVFYDCRNVRYPILRRGTPSIEFPVKEFDFGKVKTPPWSSHEFLIKNSGTGTLIIKDVKVSCPCTTVIPSSKEIPAGSEGKLSVTVKADRPLKKITEPLKGPLWIKVFTNDPKNPEVLIDLVIWLFRTEKDPECGNDCAGPLLHLILFHIIASGSLYTSCQCGFSPDET